MTPTEFLDQVDAVVEQMGLLYAHSASEKMEASLAGFVTEVCDGWRQSLTFISEADVADLVAEIADRIRKRRLEIEAGGMGTA